MGLLYTSIRVKNIKKSVEFYTKGMGMRALETRSRMPGELVASLIDRKTRQRLNLMWYSKKYKWYAPYKSNGVELDHLMFEVKDAKKSFGMLVKMGAPVAMPLIERKTPRGSFAIGFVKDPNGIWVGVRSQVKKKRYPRDKIICGSAEP